ncbi:CU044_2847 family protein [Amycolatopsis sp. NPDC088138]|uniref:CU044_2847 family protein n=1 Tax=Amycolatopsis sp. NPDC088138 TaxID=3363938 RepID=UPI0038079084
MIDTLTVNTAGRKSRSTENSPTSFCGCQTASAAVFQRHSVDDVANYNLIAIIEMHVTIQRPHATSSRDGQPNQMQGVAAMSNVVQYSIDDQTVVRFEIEPPPGFRPAGAEEIAGRIREAVSPAVDAARVVLDRVRQVRPDEVKLKFGIKVGGGATWLVAKTSVEGNFEVEMIWRPSAVEEPPVEPATAQPAAEG